jgi:sulfur-oxidizing protein SoxX
VLCSLITIPVLSAGKAKTPVEKGKVTALKLCQACHTFTGANQSGTVAPRFISMKKRFPNRKRIRDIIYDPQKAINPDTMMPPFGRHGFMNKKETERLIDFLYTL